jgi:DNA topoisomerase-1
MSNTKNSLVERKKWGKSFTYKYISTGSTLKDKKIKEWIKSLAIPPAWENTKIDLNKKAKVYAWSRDAKNRKQYIYNTSWRAKQEKIKFDRIVEFASKLPHMRRVTGQYLLDKEPSRKKVLSCMVRLLDNAYFRAGNDAYVKENETYGLTTLRSKHLKIKPDSLLFTYKGKSGKNQNRMVKDKTLVKALKQIDKIPGYEIFKYIDSDGVKHDVNSNELNEFIRDLMGEDFSAKDFRTWAGTFLAAKFLDHLGVEKKETLQKKKINQAIDKVAEELGNTKTVAKSSYIDPRVIVAYGKNTTFSKYLKEKVDSAMNQKISDILSVEENAVRELIKKG